MKTEKYHLYIGMLNPENINTALNEAYSRATKTHVLIYKQGKAPEGFKEIKETDMFRLPNSDLEWLKEVNMAVIQKFMIQHEAEKRRAEKKFLEEFEKELQKEREKLSKQDGDSE